MDIIDMFAEEPQKTFDFGGEILTVIPLVNA